MALHAAYDYNNPQFGLLQYNSPTVYGWSYPSFIISSSNNNYGFPVGNSNGYIISQFLNYLKSNIGYALDSVEPLTLENIFVQQDLFVVGGFGNDRVIATVYGKAEVYTGAGSDLIRIMGPGNHIINGGSGADVMHGGFGTDTYYVDNTADFVGDDGGLDTVRSTAAAYTLTSVVENLILDAGAISGTGNGLNNVITGNSANNVLGGEAGADTLIGGAGSDTMIGGTGNDTYSVDEVGDIVTELADGGIDVVHTALNNYTLAANVENMTIEGTGAVNVFGNELANTITGNSGKNVIHGGAGNDEIYGGGGGDWLDGNAGADLYHGGAGDTGYVFDNLGDQVVDEVAGGGNDSIWSSVAVDLRQQGDIENLRLTGTDAIDATGNDLKNLITGNSASNVIAGGRGIDSLYGKGGDDTFKFSDMGSANKDSIWDFDGGDRIELDNSIFTGLAAGLDGSLDGAHYAVNKATTTEATIVYNRSTGIVSYDADGKGTGTAQEIAFIGKTLAFFDQQDIFLV